jgi:hypothetical protein
LVTEKLLIYPRFRSKMTFSSLQPSLSDIFFELQSPSDIDLNYHVTIVEGSNWHLADFEEFISKIYMEDMDRDRPLWRMYVINDMADKRHMLLTSINHALGTHPPHKHQSRSCNAPSLHSSQPLYPSRVWYRGVAPPQQHILRHAGDGITMVEVLLSLLDPKAAGLPTNGTNRQATALAPQPPPPLPPRRANPLAGVPLLTRAAAMADGLARGILGPLIPADPPSALKAADHRRVGPERRCATSERIPLAEVSPRCTGRRAARAAALHGLPRRTALAWRRAHGAKRGAWLRDRRARTARPRTSPPPTPPARHPSGPAPSPAALGGPGRIPAATAQCRPGGPC